MFIFSLFLAGPQMGFSRQRFILVADDNLDVAFTMTILLKLFGFEVQTVHNGGDALAAARRRTPDVLLLDIGLPGLDGFQVARQFRADEKLKRVRIIAISGYSADMAKNPASLRDFDRYLTKPTDFKILLPLILANA